MDDSAGSLASDSFAQQSVVEVQADFKDWLEAFAGEPVTADGLDVIAGLIATAEFEALELLRDRLVALLEELVAAADPASGELSESYFASVEGVIDAIDSRLAPAEEPADPA